MIESPPVTLHRGDCLEYLDELPRDAAIVSDPPYGCGIPTGKHYRPIIGDDRRFDPTPWLSFRHVALFGYHHFARDLPRGGTLIIWNKMQTILSHGELCWINRGKGLYIEQHQWNGACRASERGEHYHPTQKPVEIMRRIIQRMKLPPGTTIIDPYMGVGATGIAAVQLGHPFIGIEIDEEYFSIARRRIQDATKPGPVKTATAAPRRTRCR